MKNRIIIIAAIAVLVTAAVLGAVLPEALRHYEINPAYTEKDMEVAPGLALYSGDNIGFSFLYPKYCGTGKEDGSPCVYGDDIGVVPYMIVNRVEKEGMNPERYFRGVNRQMLKRFDSVDSTPIQEVPLDGKTLYMTRYVVSGEEGSFVIDRYVEFFRGFFIEYTAVSEETDRLNTIVYYAASTLSTVEGAYKGAFSKKTERFSHQDTGVTMDLPVMLETNELTIGTISRNENAVLLSVLCTQDDEGNPIYNRQDFIDRAAESPVFVASYLGSESAEFGEGQEFTIGGKNFFCYPMTMQNGVESYTGVLSIANASDTGVYLICYAVRDGAPEGESLSALLSRCVESASFK